MTCHLEKVTLTSSATYSRSAIDIVKRAFRLIRVIDAELPLESIERQNGFEALNGFVKFLQTEGFNLWRETEAYIPLVKGKQFYDLGPNGDHAFNVDDFIPAKLTADSSNALLSLDATTGIQAAPPILSFSPTSTLQGWTVNNGTAVTSNGTFTLTNTTQAEARYSLDTTVGVTYVVTFSFVEGTSPAALFSVVDIDGELADLSVTSNGSYRLEFTARQKNTEFVFKNSIGAAGLTNSITNVNYVDKSKGDNIGVYLDSGEFFWSTVLFLAPFEMAASLPSQASSGNQVYTYTNRLGRPLSVTNTRYRRNLSFTDIPTTEWDRDNYFEQPDKTTQGIITKWYYSPQLESGRLYVWQTADSNLALLPTTYVRPFLISQENGDDPDFPSEWFDLLSFGVADMLSAEYDVPEKVLARVATKYQELLEQALGFDNDGFVEIQIDYEGRM